MGKSCYTLERWLGKTRVTAHRDRGEMEGWQHNPWGRAAGGLVQVWSGQSHACCTHWVCSCPVQPHTNPGLLMTWTRGKQKHLTLFGMLGFMALVPWHVGRGRHETGEGIQRWIKSLLPRVSWCEECIYPSSVEWLSPKRCHSVYKSFREVKGFR